MSNVICFVQPSAFTRNGMAVLDKNEKQAVYLNAVVGTVPERGRVVSGTIAENLGIVPGEFYCVVLKPGEYQGAVTYTPVSAKKMTMADIIELSNSVNTQNVVNELVKNSPQTDNYVIAEVDYDEEY